MAVNDVSAYIARANRWSFNGVILDGVQTFSGMTPTGSVSEIDVTDTSSTAMQYEGGLADPGTVSMGVLLDPSTPVYQELLESSKNGTIYELRIVVGNKAATSNYTDGAPILTSNFPAVTGAKPQGVTVAAGSATIAKANAGNLKAVKPGHYAKGETGDYRKITAVTTGANGDVTITATGLAAADVANGDTFQIYKPAWEIRRLAYVSQLGHDGGVNAAITTPLEFRASGEGNTNVGTPSITI